MFLTNHGSHLRHGVIDTFDDTIIARLVGVFRELHCDCELSAELKSVVGLEGRRASPEKDVAVHQKVGNTFDCEFYFLDWGRIGL